MEAIKSLDAALYRLNNRADDTDQHNPRRTKRGGYIWALENLNGLAYWDTEAKGWALFTAHPTHGFYWRKELASLFCEDDKEPEATPEQADAAEDFLASHVGRMARFEPVNQRRRGSSEPATRYEFVPALLDPRTVFCRTVGAVIQKLATITANEAANGVPSLALTGDPDAVRFYPDAIYYCIPEYKPGENVPTFAWTKLGQHVAKPTTPAGFAWEEPNWATYKCPSLYGKC